MKTKNRVLALILTLTMVFSLLPMGVMATETAPPPQAEETAPTETPNTEAPKTETPAQPPVGPGTGAGARVTKEAKIDTTEYATLQAAIDAVEANGIIVLLKECSFGGTFKDGNYTITGDNTNNVRTLTLTITGQLSTAPNSDTASNRTFEDLILSCTAPAGYEMFHLYGATNTFRNCLLKADTVRPLLAVAGSSQLVLEGSEVQGGIRVDSTNAAPISMKTDTDKVSGDITLGKDDFITLQTGSTATTAIYKIKTADNAADGDKIVDGTAATTILADLAAQITVNGNADWDAEAKSNDITLKRLPIRYVSSSGNDANNGTSAKPYATLQAAYAGLPEAGGEIRLLSDLNAAAATTFGEAKNVTVTSCKTDGTAWAAAEDTRTVKRDAGFTTDSVLKVSNGTVTLGHITLDGNKGAVAATAPLVSVAAAKTLTLGDGATIQNNKNTTNSGLGGGVAVSGTLTMNSGSTITGNTLTGTGSTYGGGVYVADGANFQMNGGTISNNSVTATGGSGGGIMVAPAATTATVTISGDAKISGNSCGANGAAIHGGAAGSTIAISGTATITGNQITGATFVGGAVYPHFSTITAAGGVKITGNTNNAGKPSNLYLKADTTLKLSGELTEGANIGVYMQNPPTGEGATKSVAVSGNSYAVQAADATHVHSDNGGAAIVQFKDGGSVGSDIADTLELKVLAKNVYVKSDGLDAAPGTGAKEHPYATLAKAYAEVATGGTIHVMDDLDPVAATTTFNVDKKITLESCKTTGDPWGVDTDTHTIKRADGFKLTMLDITAGEVTMKHLVLDGVGGLMDSVGTHGADATPVDATAPLVEVHSKTKAPTLTLSDGAVLQNNHNTAGACAGIKVGSGDDQYGNLNIQDGAKIQYNQTGGTAEDSSSGCAVYVRGTHTQFTMTGGEISHNSGEAYATVNFCMNKDGTAVISGGSITANTCTKAAGTGGVLVDEKGILTITGGNITNNTGAYGGVALWDGTGVLNMGGGAAINITGNKTSGDVVRNVYLNGTKINITSPLTEGSTIGVYSTAIPTPGHPVQVATGANATDATYFTSDNLVGAGIRAAKSGDTDNTGIYLDAAEKMKVQIIKADSSKVLYKTFDEAMAAIKADSGNALVNSVGNDYKIELLADCTTDGAFPVENITMESTGGQKYTLMVKNYITTDGGTFTANNIKFADATPEHEWLQAYSTWTFSGCELPNFAIVGKTVTLTDGTVVNGNIRIDSNTAGNLAIKAGDVPVNGTISINNATSVITLLAGSDATKRYNVQYANTIALADSQVVMTGATDNATAKSIAKNVSILGGSNAAKEWIATDSTTTVVLKQAKSYWVSEQGDDTANGTFATPFKTIAKAYTAGAAEVGLDIRVLSDLPTTAATTFANEAITSVKISSYKGENAVADKPWTITRKDVADPLLTVTKGAVNLTNITLDGNKNAVDATAALVSVGTGTSLTLNDGATIQNNKNKTDSGLGGGVAVSGTLTMNSGSTITGNTLTGTGSTYGGGVYVANGATFRMNGGTISNNTVTSVGGSGGAIMVAPAATTATVRIGGDALITGNSCGANGAAIHGGKAGSTIAISGNAKITGNRITAATGYVGAAVYPYNGSLVLSGDVQITGNSNQNGSACNVYLPIGKTITIGGAHMGAGSSVGVYCETMPAATGETVDIATNAVEADSGHFFSDKMSEAGIKFDGDKVVLAYDARYIPQPGPDKPDPGVTVEPGPGKVTTWPKNPDPGTKVTVTIEPETGWEIDKVIIVTVPGGEPVVITGTNPITYIAPDPNTVKITVKYKRIPVDPKISGVSELLNSDTHIAFMVGDNFGKFNPQQGITRAETAQLFYNLLRNKDVDGGSFFDDVKTGLWYTEAVDTLAAMGILEGNGDGTYKPDENISRAEFTAIAMRFARSTKGEVTFTDVPAGYWAESAISGAAQYGWVMGYADGSFKPQGDITRGEAAKIVNTMLGRFPDTAFIDSAEGLKLFPDVTKNHWAFYQIAEASNAHGFTKENNVETWTK